MDEEPFAYALMKFVYKELFLCLVCLRDVPGVVGHPLGPSFAGRRRSAYPSQFVGLGFFHPQLYS